MFCAEFRFSLSSKREYILLDNMKEKTKQFQGAKMRIIICLFLAVILIGTDAYSSIRTMSNRKKAYSELTSGVSKVKLTREPEVSDEIRLVTFGFSSYAPSNVTDVDSELTAGNKFLQDENTPAEVTKVLNFPNPFQLDSGSVLRYELSKNMDIEILVYDMLSNEIISVEYKEGFSGGVKGKNDLLINKDSFDGKELSAGIYFYYIRHNGELMAKGKLAIIP